MELIPVFSLIVLVATIMTFILAVGAYVMFRVRESRATRTQPRPAGFEADVFAPEPVDMTPPSEIPGTAPRRDFPREKRPVPFEPDPYGPEGGATAEERRRWR